MSTVMIYRSKYGHTKRYADLIQKEIGCDVVNIKKLKKKEIQKYNTVIFGTGVYMGKMKKLNTILNLFKNKPIIIFACGGNNNVEEDIEQIKNSNFTQDQLEFHQFFYLPGGMDVSKVKGPMKFMFRIIGKMLEKKENRTHDEDEFLKSLKNP